MTTTALEEQTALLSEAAVRGDVERVKEIVGSATYRAAGAAEAQAICERATVDGKYRSARALGEFFALLLAERGARFVLRARVAALEARLVEVEEKAARGLHRAA